MVIACGLSECLARHEATVAETELLVVHAGSFRVPLGPSGERPSGVCARIGFSIDADGRAVDVQVSRSSGFRSVDRAAAQSVRNTEFMKGRARRQAALVFGM
ncbi:TonB family protein [Arenimonas composti]|uniref:TonB family protein n=1 Tax=Arenimonas composti TaxID=370776 RepID=UPI001FE06D38|nr:TonB family protein [Arenimonas composti]